MVINMGTKIKSDDMDFLMKVISTIDNPDDCYTFFEDLCTIPELKAMAGRLEVARLLFEGKGYNDIKELTSASSATISRVNKCLMYGENGYKSILKKMKVEN